MPSRRSAFRLFLISFLLITLGVHAAIPTSGLVGSLKGEFSVDPSGAANYDIPITLPPNVGGVQPKLSFHYNSNSGNGLMGMGWQLAGLSEITRCPTTLERDGYIDGVDFDSNDQFCLDGQRLVSIGSGQYRTEIDNFSHITGTTSAGFTVYAPDGTTLYYGTSSSSQILAQGKSHVMVWALERVEDMAGNHYRVEYQNDGSSLGEYYPTAIYMGNGSQDLSSVEFEYEDRLDVISGYAAGSRYQTSQRLVGVETFVGATLVKGYSVGYSPYFEPLNYSVLDKVQECDPVDLCLQAIVLTGKNYEFDLSHYLSSSYCANGSMSYGVCNDSDNTDSIFYPDISGDGLADLCYRSDSGIRCYLGNGSQFDATKEIATDICANLSTKYGVCNDGDNYRTIRFLDFNADGMSDLVFRSDQGLRVLFSKGTSFEEMVASNICANGSTYFGTCNDSDNFENIHFPDINGDGLTDVCYRSDNGIRCFLGNGSQFDTTKEIATDICANLSTKYGVCNDGDNYRTIRFLDFNADGMSDLVFRSDQGLRVWLSKGASFEEMVVSNICANGSTYFGRCNDSDNFDYIKFPDVNGDGLVDVCYRGDFGINCVLGTGNGFDTGNIISTDICATLSGNYGICNDDDNYTTIDFVDFNADAKSDLIFRSDQGFRLMLSTGVGFEDVFSSEICKNGWMSHGVCNDRDNYFNINYVDLDGDLIPEIVYRGDQGIQGLDFYKLRPKRVEIFSSMGDVSLTYIPLVSTAVYTKDTRTVSTPNSTLVRYPSPYNSISQHPTPAMYVVSTVTQPDGVGGTKSASYKYEGLRYDRYAKRSLGFAKTTITDNKTLITTENLFSQSYPFVGMVLDTQSYRSTVSRLLSKATYTLKSITTDATRKIFFPTVSASTETSHFYNNALTRVGSKFVTTTQTHNASGQVEASTSVITGDGHTYTTTTTNEYTNGYTYRRQGEVTRSSVSTYSDIATEQTRASEFDYDWSTGRLLKEVIEPDSTDASIKRVAVHSYDDFGNKTRTITCSGTYEFNCTTTTPGARFSTTTFDANGLFPISASNALGHTATSTFDARFGVVLTATDINGLTTTNQYDSLGRLTRSTNPLGVATTVTRVWCTTTTCPIVGGNQAYYKITTQAPDIPTSVVYFDQYDREVRKQATGFGGQLIYVDTEYDSFGRVKRTSEPYFVGETAYWNTPTYDLLGRNIKMTTPKHDGTYADSLIDYNGYLTNAIDALNRTTVEEKDALGRVIAMTDKEFGVTRYEYDALGNLLETTDPLGNQVTLTYDIRGRKLTMNDPDMGNWTYQYNVFDELVEQKDGKDQRTRMVYDSLGRMMSRIDAYGSTSPQTSSWSFSSTAGKTLGKPTQKTAPNGDYTSYTYNTTYGQLVSTTQKIGSKNFTLSNTYDIYGRVNAMTYPATAAYPTGFKVLRDYSGAFLYQIRDAVTTTKAYWRMDITNARGQVEAVTYANGVQDLNAYSDANGWLVANESSKGASVLRDMTYSFDAVGRILTRVDYVQNNLTENFSYDDLDRLTGSYMTGSTTGPSYVAKSYDYDALGNITNKSDVGSYSYTGCGNRPHAVCNAGGTTYVYDANGSMTSGTKGGATTTVGYTSYNLANYMAKGNYALTFNYDADRNRNYKSRIQSGSLNLQIYYVGTDAHGNKLYEQEVGGTTKDIHYIYGGDGQTVAAHIGEGTAKRTEYYHRDHLGSVELVTNDAGTAVSKVSFDPWGQRRNENWTDNATGTGLPAITGNIGFTGQESITEIGLIHMNGRIYDPMLGRFLSADPIIQAPYNSQSYNRYSYVMNNPLSFVDPSGYSWLSKKWKKVKEFAQKNWSAVKYAATWYFAGDAAAFWSNKSVRNYIKDHKWAQQTLSVVAGVADAMGCMGACTAGMTTYLAKVQGASWSDALKAGGRAGAAAYIMAVAGGANRGGNAYGGNWLETGAITGAAGGVGAEITGGNFADGFKMSAGSALLKSAIEKFTTYAATYDTPDSSDSVLKPNSDMIGDKILCPSCDVVNPNANNIGKANYALSIDQVGKTAAPGFWSASEGAGWSRALSKIPGFNSGAVFHDVFVGTTGRLLGTQNWGVFGSAMGELIYNQGTIVPLIGMNYVALGQATLARNNRNALEYY